MTLEIFGHRIHHLQDEVLILGGWVEQSMIDDGDALRRLDAATIRLIFTATGELTEFSSSGGG